MIKYTSIQRHSQDHSFMAKNKTLLIGVGNFFDGNLPAEPVAPLGIIYLGSYLFSRGYRVSLLDVNTENRDAFFVHLKNELQDAGLVGLSVMTPLTNEGLQITKFVKKFDPTVPVVWGGFHATLFPELTLRNEYIDFVITGEGERGLLGLAGHLFQKKEITDIPNLMYKTSGMIMKNRVEPGEGLSSIGIPSYDIIDCRPYITHISSSGQTSFNILSSRGCPGRCAFCVNSIILNSNWRAEPIEQTLRNIDTVIGRFNPSHICFADEFFFCDLERINALAPELAKRKITWDANCRADYIQEKRINDKMLRMLHECGCSGFRIGMESGSQRILDLLNKQITPEQSIYAIKKICQFQMEALASFMMGIPGEKPDDVMKTLDLILKIHTINPKIQIVGPNMFQPYPGSILFNTCVKKGLVEPVSLDEWSTFFMPNFPVYQKNNYPWLTDMDVCRKVNIWSAYLKKQYIPRWFRHRILKFHIITQCKFIILDYALFRFLKKIIKFLRGSNK